jgi:hypothetical protein
MADKMNKVQIEGEDPIRKLVLSEEIRQAPDDLLYSIMNEIEKRPAHQPLKPFNPPAWLKWGIPSVLGISFILTMIFGKSLGQDSLQLPKFRFGLNFSEATSRLSDITSTLTFPDLNIPDYFIWIAFGSLILFWAFFALNRFLEKH